MLCRMATSSTFGLMCSARVESIRRTCSSPVQPRRVTLADIQFTIDYEQEVDGRWIAEVVELPGALAYGQRLSTAIARIKALALRVVAERLEHGEELPAWMSITFAEAA